MFSNIEGITSRDIQYANLLIGAGRISHEILAVKLRNMTCTKTMHLRHAKWTTNLDVAQYIGKRDNAE